MRARIWFAPTVDSKISSAFLCVYPRLIFLFASAAILSAAPRWNIQYLYDHADSNFAIEDLQCPTAQHCVAAGLIDDKKGHEQGTVVVTGDGGLHWSQYEVKERPLSLFFLNQGLGWMVTDKGLWSTAEGGRAWTKIQSRKGILRVWFLDAAHGYIAGLKGLIQETGDGGKTWAELEASKRAPDASALDFGIVSFQGKHGVIIGAPQTSALALLDLTPASPAKGKLTLLETLDGGQKWAYGALPVDGELAQLKMSPRGFVVSLMLYSDPKYPVGSAVFQTPLGSPEGRMIFAERDRAATDIALLNDGGAVLVTVEPPGNSTQVPIPGKLKIFESENLKVWREMDVDYRAVAQRAVIAAPDAKHMWVATDTGAILSWVD
jgi:photosynthesis system II assembly factor YCF48-like protein